MRPIPIAVRLPSGLTLRGHEWPREGPPVLLVHDLGEDLDVWTPLPHRLVDAGFRVVATELRGHGLSDGHVDPATTIDDLEELVAQLHETFGPVAFVCHGSLSAVAFRLSSEPGAPVHVVVSPREGPVAIDRRSTTAALRLVVNGTLDEPSQRYVEEIYPAVRGQNLWITTATADAGPRLLTDRPNLFEQLVIFLRRYLTPLSEAWAEEHASPDGANPSGPLGVPED